MKRLSYALIIGSLALAFSAGGEESAPASPGLSAPAPELPPPPPGQPPAEVSPRSHEGRSWRGSHGSGPGGFRSRFRAELETMREEIQRTRSLIASLEGQIEAAPTAEARRELSRRLAEARRRSAEIQLTLARKKVEITRQALEFSKKRYDDALMELQKTMNKLRDQYPDLVGAPATPPAD
jgi:hypothetical protein